MARGAARQLAIFSNAFADAHRAPRSFNNHERCACSLEPAHACARLKRRRHSTAAPFEYYRRGADKAGTVFTVTQAWLLGHQHARADFTWQP